MDLKEKYEKALKIALHFIKYRPRSKGEVIRKLKDKKVDPDLIPDLIEYLEESRWLNDEDFTRLWVDSRLHSKYLGPHRIRRELHVKNIEEFLIEDTLEEYFSERPLEEWAMKFLKNKYGEKLYTIQESKQIEVLQRNGYDYHTAALAVRLLSSNTENEVNNGNQS